VVAVDNSLAAASAVYSVVVAAHTHNHSQTAVDSQTVDIQIAAVQIADMRVIADIRVNTDSVDMNLVDTILLEGLLGDLLEEENTGNTPDLQHFARIVELSRMEAEYHSCKLPVQHRTACLRSSSITRPISSCVLYHL